MNAELMNIIDMLALPSGPSLPTKYLDRLAVGAHTLELFGFRLKICIMHTRRAHSIIENKTSIPLWPLIQFNVFLNSR